MSLKGIKQTPEHIAKRVAARWKNNTYIGQNLGHKGYGRINSTSFKKGHKTWNKGIKKDIPIKLISKMYLEESMSTYDIGIKFNVSQKTIENRLKESGIKLRGRGELHTPSVRRKIRLARSKQKFPMMDSSIEVKLQNFLREMQLEFFTHYYVNIRDAYQCDIFIPKQIGISQKTIIEADGDYFHGSPLLYPDWRQMSIKQKTQKIRDYERTAQLEEQGFKVIRLWESDIKKLSKPEFEVLLK